MRVKMTLISKDIYVKKICTSEIQIKNFVRDMPAKYNLLFSKIPYVIGNMDLEEILKINPNYKI